MRNRPESNRASTGFVLRFKSLAVAAHYDRHTIQYTYDGLSRLLTADYDSGTTVYSYGYDLAGNLVDLDGTTRTYNAANQMTHDGTNTLTYDANGNLTNDGGNAYSWDRANRMLTAPGSTSYKYDGMGNRIQQTVSSVVTNYLLDLQPGLTKVLRQADGTNTDHFIHAPRGIHAQYDGTDWQYVMQDGLGSVRGLIDATLGVDAVQSYDPMGVPDGSYGAGFGFTGEQTDANDMLFLCARYYNPSLGVFPSLDPFEGTMQRPMSLNVYAWVEGNTPNDAVGELIFHNRYSYAGGNPVNRVDSSGMCWVNSSASPDQQSQCHDAWLQYTNIITDTYTQDWPRDVRILMTQEARYWANLPYSEFVSQWNSSRPPASTDPGGEVLQSALPIAGGVSILNPAPGPEDVLALGGLCIAAIWSIAANAGAISLPLHQPYHFSSTSDESSDQAVPIPIPRPGDYDSCQNNWKNCAQLEKDGGCFASFEDAIDEVKRVKSIEVFEDLDERLVPTRSHCPGMGSHSQFYDTPTYDEKYVASVTCCPCCNNDWGMPLPDVRCFVKYNRTGG